MLSLTLGTAAVFGQASLQAIALGLAELGLSQLHLLGVLLIAAPHPEAAHQHVIAVVQPQLVQLVPAPLLTALFGPHAHHAPHFQAVHQQAHSLELAQHIIVIRGHSVTNTHTNYPPRGVRITILKPQIYFV